MAAIITRRRRLIQPQGALMVDPRWLSFDQQGASYPGSAWHAGYSDGTVAFDALGLPNVDNRATITSAPRIDDGYGVGWSFGSGSPGVVSKSTAPTLGSTHPLTILLYANIFDTAADHGLVTQFASFSFVWAARTTGTYQVYSSAWTDLGLAVQTHRPVLSGMVVTSSGASTFYRDATFVSGPSMPQSEAVALTVGSWGAANYLNGVVYYCVAIPRAFDRAEIEDIAEYPYALFAPRTRRLYFGAAAAGGSVGSAVGTSVAKGIEGYIAQATGSSVAKGIEGYIAKAVANSTVAGLSGSLGSAVGTSVAKGLQGYFGSAVGTSVAKGIEGYSSAIGTSVATGTPPGASSAGHAIGTSTATGVSGSVGSASSTSIVAGIALSSAAGYYPTVRKKRRILIAGRRYDVKDDYELDYLLHTLLDKRPEDVERTPKELRRVSREPVTRVVVPASHKTTAPAGFADETYIRLVKQAGEDQALQIALDRVWTARLQVAQRALDDEDERDVEILVNALLASF